MQRFHIHVRFHVLVELNALLLAVARIVQIVFETKFVVKRGQNIQTIGVLATHNTVGRQLRHVRPPSAILFHLKTQRHVTAKNMLSHAKLELLFAELPLLLYLFYRMRRVCMRILYLIAKRTIHTQMIFLLHESSKKKKVFFSKNLKKKR
jgi:hypothetical protein